MLPALIMQGTRNHAWSYMSRPPKRQNRPRALGTAAELSSPIWEQQALKYPLPLLTGDQVSAMIVVTMTKGCAATLFELHITSTLHLRRLALAVPASQPLYQACPSTV